MIAQETTSQAWRDELRLSDTAVKQSQEGLLICAYCEIKLVNCAVDGSQVPNEKAGVANF